MKRSEVIELAKIYHEPDPKIGEEPKEATRRWVEVTDDPTQPGPVRDVLVWVVEFGGDDGATCDVYIEDAAGTLVKKDGYA
jgi:hypothetical protein